MVSRNINPLTVEQKKQLKAEYDKQYRIRNLALLQKKKADYYQRTRDPEKERIKRKENMQKHVAYCRNPDYVKKKAAYDKQRRFEAYGPFGEAARLLEELQKEIKKRATRYEIYIANGRFIRAATQRRRELWQLMHKN